MAFLPAMLPAIAGLVGAGASIYSTVQSSKSRKAQQRSVTPNPTAPNYEESEAKAREDMKRRRKISFLSGGKTDMTRGTGVVGQSSIGTKSLLGE